jgi:hypothetical protein
VKFMATFTIKPETKGRDEAIARFQATGGQPPKGLKLIGRWTAADFSGGFVLLEGDDQGADRVRADVDADLGEVLARREK